MRNERSGSPVSSFRSAAATVLFYMIAEVADSAFTLFYVLITVIRRRSASARGIEDEGASCVALSAESACALRLANLAKAVVAVRSVSVAHTVVRLYTVKA